MQKYYRIPLIFLVLAATIGLFLRWQFVAPTPGINYTFFLHGHSHVMFLGWVFNVLFLAFTEHSIIRDRRNYIVFFGALQLLVVAMMISFPLQGYGFYSIVFSTLHTLAVMVFIPFFFKATKADKRVSTWYARMAWIFFLISTAGPFVLGMLMANGMGKTVWSNFAIYYYLHFQYNGFFLFGIFSLFFQMLESGNIQFPRKEAYAFGKWMAIACIPAYALSILFANPGLIFNVVGGGAALIQLLALYYLLPILREATPKLRAGSSRLVSSILQLVVISHVAKSLLQLASSHPAVAEFAYALRPVVIAYLHLALVGVISFFLLSWYLRRGFVSASAGHVAIGLFFLGYIGSEVCLVLIPWWSRVVGPGLSPVAWIFGFSVLMLAGALLFLLSFRGRANADRSG